MIGTIFIKDLVLPCHLGETVEERTWPQNIIVNMECDVDVSKAVASDDLADTVDYRDMHAQLLDLAATSQFALIETFAAAAIKRCFEDARITRVKVSVAKPYRLAGSRSIGIVIEQKRA